MNQLNMNHYTNIVNSYNIFQTNVDNFIQNHNTPSQRRNMVRNINIFRDTLNLYQNQVSLLVFINDYRQILLNIENSFKSTQTLRGIGSVINAYNNLLTNTLQFRKYHYAREDVTRKFEDFLKGITYFGNEVADVAPIYHREQSCRPILRSHDLHIDDIANNYHCHDTLTNNERNRRKKLVHKCYLERLIFSEMWKNEFTPLKITGRA